MSLRAGSRRRHRSAADAHPSSRLFAYRPWDGLLDLVDYEEPVLRRLDLLPQQPRVAGEADELPRCQEVDHARPRIARAQQRALAGLARAPEKERGPRARRKSQSTLEQSPRIIMHIRGTSMGPSSARPRRSAGWRPPGAVFTFVGQYEPGYTRAIPSPNVRE